jgi:hypothetical protein
MKRLRALSGCVLFALVTLPPAPPTNAQPQAAPCAGATPQESPSDAWWTGPLLAPTAATLPQGHFYIEPYLYDSLPYAQFDGTGRAHGVPRQNDFGSLTYFNFGVTDDLTVGLISRFGYDSFGSQSSSSIGVGDPTVQAQYRLTHFLPESGLPTLSLNLQETLPAGRYDRLERATDGFGAGAWTTTLSTYLQSYFWLANGRILRARLDLSYAVSSSVTVVDQSVYGTSAGFRGHATPGRSAFGDLAFEYSATRNWVLALDVWFQHDGSTRVAGTSAQLGGRVQDYLSRSGTGRELILAPALEYNWSGRAGIIIGVRVVAAGRNETGLVTPVAAFSYFL